LAAFRGAGAFLGLRGRSIRGFRSEVTDLKHLAGVGFSQQQRAPTRVTVPRTLYDIWAAPATSLGWQHLTADRAKAAFD
jgi:hypothetical protein